MIFIEILRFYLKFIKASYAFEVASNRYDLLSAEGIARNLSIYLGNYFC